MQEHYQWIEDSFNSGRNVDQICSIFGVNKEDLVDSDFFFYFADIYTIGVQYGGRTELCDMLIANHDLSMTDQMKSVSAYGTSKGVAYDQYFY